METDMEVERNAHRKQAWFCAALLALVLAGLSGASYGADSNRYLSDPSYLPWRGQVMGTSIYTYIDTYMENRNFKSAVVNTKDIASNQWVQSFGYGLTDDLTVRLSDTLVRQQIVTNLSAGGSTTYFSQGSADPTLGIAWRVLDEAAHPFNWDLIGSYAPNLFEAEAASSTQTGTVARGGQSGVVGTAVSWVSPRLTLYSNFEETYLGTKSIINADDSVSDYGDYLESSLSFNSQYRFAKRISANAGITQYWDGSYTGTNEKTGVNFTVGLIQETAINAALNYQIIPEAFTASLTYNNDSYWHGNSVYPLHTNFDSTITGNNTNTVGVRIEYIFL
jgi:hypothetical protein